MLVALITAAMPLPPLAHAREHYPHRCRVIADHPPLAREGDVYEFALAGPAGFVTVVGTVADSELLPLHLPADICQFLPPYGPPLAPSPPPEPEPTSPHLSPESSHLWTQYLAALGDEEHAP